MKKIAILTLPLSDNYGGMLQAVALYGFLAGKGYSVVFLKNQIFRKMWKLLIWLFLERIPFQKFKRARCLYIKKIYHGGFLKKHLPNQTVSLYRHKDFVDVIERGKFDAVIVGSDQVWRWDYIWDGYNRYFLDFVGDVRVRKIAYAASFGNSHWQMPALNDRIAKLLARFHAVSTRESDGVKVCCELGRSDCRNVLDPTLLVDSSFYENLLAPIKTYTGKKNLLTYILDESSDKSVFVKNFHETLGDDFAVRIIGLCSDLTVPEWVSEFRYADFVITDSFHGMVFSIIFKKQFLVIANRERGLSRFTSLLSLLGLEDRLISEDCLDFDAIDSFVREEINYSVVDAKIGLLREQSSDFLLRSIESA